MDWKDQLKAFADSNPDLPEGDAPATADAAPERPEAAWERLTFAIEKKGRGGKTATIIAGFTCSDERLRAILKFLQRNLGTGGSARGGEILLQGKWDDQARALLKSRSRDNFAD